MRRLVLLVIGPLSLGALGLAAAAAPPLLAGVSPGLWEVSPSATGAGARRMCVRDVLELGAVAQQGRRCERTILRRGAEGVVLDITCPGGDFARSSIEVTTPRSLRIETQGIRSGEPFDMRLYARRTGSCLSFSGRR